MVRRHTRKKVQLGKGTQGDSGPLSPAKAQNGPRSFFCTHRLGPRRVCAYFAILQALDGRMCYFRQNWERNPFGRAVCVTAETAAGCSGSGRCVPWVGRSRRRRGQPESARVVGRRDHRLTSKMQKCTPSWFRRLGIQQQVTGEADPFWRPSGNPSLPLPALGGYPPSLLSLGL